MKGTALAIILLLLGVYINAQDALQNNGNLQIHPGATMTAFQNFTNASSGALVNNGTLYVQGALSNAQSSMTAGTGTLHLNGSSAQAVNGSQTFKTYNLVTNNTAGITLNNNLSIAAAHTFTAGLITASANYLIYEAGSSYTGTGDARHVNGWVRKEGTTDFIFPVGNATYERTIQVTNLSASSVFNARYAGVTTNATNVASPIVTVNPNEYWVVDQMSGGTAQMAMNWNFSKVAFPNYVLSDIRVANYTAGNWTNRGGSASGNVTTTGAITSGSLSTFGSFVIGSISGVLPLQFLKIAAYRKQGSTLVQWKTAHEINVDHFEIERSNNNATAFKKIGTTASQKSSGDNLYEYPDKLPLGGTAYYRIRSVDIDGKTKYSPVAVVSDNSDRGSMQLLNNPASQYLHLAVSDAYKGLYEYEILGSSGRLVQKGKMQSNGNDVITIPLSATTLPATYILHIHNDKHQFTQKLIVRP